MVSCTKCKGVKPVSEFSTFKMKGKEYRRGTCKECVSEKDVLRVKEWRLEDSLRKACARLKLDYQYVLAYYQSHNGLCEICGDKPTMKRLVLDHNHETGAFRGLLCSQCNRGIGLLRDSAPVLRAAVSYLER